MQKEAILTFTFSEHFLVMVVVTHTNNTTAYNNDRQQRHVRIEIELGNESESEQCEMLMQFLDWSYEFIFGSEIGQINDHVHNASTG